MARPTARRPATTPAATPAPMTRVIATASPDGWWSVAGSCAVRRTPRWAPVTDGLVAALLGVEDRAEVRRLAARVDAITAAMPRAARIGLRGGARTLDALAL